MNAILETLMLRRPVINYVSPAACEIILSGSGVGAFIVLTPFSRIHKVGGLRLTETSPGSFTLNWDTTPGGDPPTICYNVYQLVGGELVLVAECVNPPDGGGGVPLPPGSPGGGDTYVVTPVTPEGEGPGSDPVTTPVIFIDPCAESGDDTTCSYGSTGAQYRIKNYNSALFDITDCGLSWTNCINCEIAPDTNCADPVEWPGSFPTKVNDVFFIDQAFDPIPGGAWPPAHLLHGFCMSATLSSSGSDNSTGCGWAVVMTGYLGENLWAGIKSKGEGPIGKYQRVSGCCPGPVCVEVEAY